MKIGFIYAFLLGALLVFQPVFNRLMLDTKGLSFVSLLNSAIVFLLTILAFGVINYGLIGSSPLLSYKPDGPFYWWFIIPGICGAIIIFSLPLIIKELGAFTAVLVMICGQVTTSLLLDLYVDHIPLNQTRIIGLILTIAGAFLSFRPR